MNNIWLTGLFISLIGGAIASWAFILLTTKFLKLPEKPDKDNPRIPGWLTGIIERSFFFMLIRLGIDGVVESGMAWLALKLAANWQRYNVEKYPPAHTRTLLALLAGLISLAFAYLGGKIASGNVSG